MPYVIAATGGGRLLRGTGPDLGPTAVRFPAEERTLLHALRAQVAERPNQAWLVFDGGRRLTFAEAQTGAYAFASALRERALAGVGVALFLRNQREFTLAFLGAQAAGGIAVPLNPELRGPLLTTMLARSNARILVLRADLVERALEVGDLAGVELVVACGASRRRGEIDGVPVVDFDDWIATAPPATPASLPRSSELRALMFTSGTSGGSKAAACSHHYLYLFAACVVDSMEFPPHDVLSTPAADVPRGGLQVFAHASLLAGCTCHLKEAFLVRDYWRDIAADGATFSMLMGQMASLILREVPEAPPHRLAHTYIVPQPQDRVEFERRYGTKVIWQGWGMTEVFPHVPRKQRLEDVPADTIGPAPAWFDYGVVDAEDRMLGPGGAGGDGLSPAGPGRHGARLLQRSRGHVAGLSQLHVPHRGPRLLRRARSRALRDAQTGRDPAAWREHLRGRARARRPRASGDHRRRGLRRARGARRA